MIVLGYRFEPKVWVILITIIAVILFLELGKWQLSRADEKNAQHEQIERYAKQPTIALPGTSIKLQEYQYRDVEVRGEYLFEHTIYLDNKIHQGRAGYHIITPLKIANSSLYVVINRGWVATGDDRSLLPKIPEVEGEVKITGMVVSPEIRTLKLSDKLTENQVWGYFNLERFQETTGLELQPIIILQKNEVADDLIRDWHKPDSGASKNIGYAVQWFLLAGTAIIIFIVLNVKRKNPKSE